MVLLTSGTSEGIVVMLVVTFHTLISDFIVNKISFPKTEILLEIKQSKCNFKGNGTLNQGQ